MEHVDILNRIVEAENRAQEMSNEALGKRASLKDDLRAEHEKIRASYMERAKKRLAAVSEEENRHAQEIIEEQDRRLAQDLARVDDLFKENFEIWVNRLVDKVIGV